MVHIYQNSPRVHFSSCLMSFEWLFWGKYTENPATTQL